MCDMYRKPFEEEFELPRSDVSLLEVKEDLALHYWK
jgi:hypothetical protein